MTGLVFRRNNMSMPNIETAKSVLLILTHYVSADGGFVSPFFFPPSCRFPWPTVHTVLLLHFPVFVSLGFRKDAILHLENVHPIQCGGLVCALGASACTNVTVEKFSTLNEPHLHHRHSEIPAQNAVRSYRCEPCEPRS